MNNRKLIVIGDSTYSLLIEEFGEEIQVDDLLRIDYSNLLGEIITFPVVVNRLGSLLAEAEQAVSEKKLNLEVFEAKLKERKRILLTEENNGKSPTVDALNTAIILDKGYQALKKSFFESQKNRDYVNSIFWSAKDKSEKLNKLSLTVSTGDIEESLLEGKVNNITVTKRKNTIK